jgi:hypothetical protein
LLSNSESPYNYYWEEYDDKNNIIAYGYGYATIPENTTDLCAYIAGNQTFSDAGGILIVIIDDEEDD